MPAIASFPTINASLNALAALFLLAGFIMIKRQNIPAHKTFMALAAASSILFLACYLYYHAHAGSVRFQGTGPLRTIYFAILLTHTILASLLPFVVPVLLYRALKCDFERHKKMARWVWPVWMYVSVTGVVIYIFLYVLPVPAAV
jgi:uncharacterized membrane protein YozB (DUF420 family)